MADLEEHRALIDSVTDRPYSTTLRLRLSNGYVSLGYPDLAAGEAYLALLLIDEINDESGEYHQEAFEAAQQDLEAVENAGVVEDLETSFDSWLKNTIERTAYILLVQNLFYCDNFRSATEFCSRGLAKFDCNELTRLQSDILTKLKGLMGNAVEKLPLEARPDRGLVRREVYPWNQHEPDRFSNASISFLNDQVQKIAPKLEVRVTELPDLSDDGSSSSGNIKQLGIFAKEELKPGEVVLNEISLLTATSKLNDLFCDACSAALSEAGSSSVVSCPECAETIFCSENCLDLALASYHPALCEADISSIAKDARPSEAADALYSLLLLRSLAMAETQNVHPLDLTEVKYIWGDYQAQNLTTTTESTKADPFLGHLRTLPFSFQSNILLPLHMLEKLDINIFATSRLYSPWVFNTLYAKFRGTASARQGPKGLPEVGAVHPLWCLANHSCDPNVTWEWQGGMKFWVREQRVKWKGKEAPKIPGIKADEEILSHYCDIDLPVHERQEWAAGALGGFCRCERCLWENKS